MPKVGFCKSLHIAMILGRDWQTALHATITIEPSGAICINTPSISQNFGCLKSSKSSIGCVIQSRYDNKSLISKTQNPVDNKIKSTPEKPLLLNREKQILEDILIEYQDFFSTPDNKIGEFPEFQIEINPINIRPVKCKPYKASESDKQFMHE